MGARRIKRVGNSVYDNNFVSSEDWVKRFRRDCRSYQDKKEKRKENRKRDAEALEDVQREKLEERQMLVCCARLENESG
jgi:hypothetical protein